MALFGRKAATSEVNATLLGGGHQMAVVGESHYQDALWRQAAAQRGEDVRFDSVALLVPEPQNEFDTNAIAVVLSTGKAGYLSREDATRYLPGLHALMAHHGTAIAVRCTIIGGGYNGTQARSLGVWLDHDPNDFGAPTAKPATPTVRTGETAAGARNWESRLPDDSIKRIAHVRKLLATETEPVERHFLYSTLEESLYKCREVFPTALADYEATAIAHDSEMTTIVPALIAEFGGIPLLVLYKQMAILKTKAKDEAAALHWARRGLDVYGRNSLRDESVTDLQTRVSKLEAKLGITVPSTSASAQPPPPSTPQVHAPAGWLPDPSGRFQHRYWDGARWTEHVATNGVSSTDPPTV